MKKGLVGAVKNDPQMEWFEVYFRYMNMVLEQASEYGTIISASTLRPRQLPTDGLRSELDRVSATWAPTWVSSHTPILYRARGQYF